MKKVVLLFGLLCAGLHLFAQNLSLEYGKVAKDDLELTSYAEDKEAEAVVFFDIGSSRFLDSDTGFEVLFERSTRVKILTEAGLDFAKVEIPIYRSNNIFEKVYDLEATTYNVENGMLVKTPLDLSTVYTETVSEYWSVKKFAMPNVKPGSIVEWRYKLQSEYVFNLRNWEFQWKIPVVYSQYTVRITPFLHYSFWLQGAQRLAVQEGYEDFKNPRRLPFATPVGNDTYNEMVYVFGMKDVPAFRDEEFISSVSDYILKMNFQLSRIYLFNGSKREIITTWDQLSRDLLKHEFFGKYIDKAEKLAPKLLDMGRIQTLSQAERFDEVVNFVKNNFSWDGYNSKYADKSPDKLVKEKLGNSAELNLMLVGLLRAAGVEAQPMISSTRGHGTIQTEYPFESFFNYTLVLARLDNQVIVTDATDPMTLNNRIPERCINDRALVVEKEQQSWVGLNVKVPSYKTTYLDLKPEANYQLEANIKYAATEYEARRLRSVMAEGNEAVRKKLSAYWLDLDEESIETDGLDDKTKNMSLSFRQTGEVERINGKIYLNPFLGLSAGSNPLTQKVRTYPVDMVHPKLSSFKSVITIPEGYELSYVPEETMIDNQQFSLFYQHYVEEGKLYVNFSYYFKQAVYAPADYEQVKDYFTKLVKWGTDRIVLAPTSQLYGKSKSEAAENN